MSTLHRGIVPVVFFSNLPRPESMSGARLPDRLAIGCLSAAAILGPLALGGTATWARLGLESAAAAAVAIWSLSGPRPRWLVLLPLGIAVLACLQIVPLPPAVLRLAAPPAAAAWQASEPSAWGSVSINPGATASGIRQLLLGLATAAVVSDLGRIVALRRWLVGSVAVSGLLIWTLGLVFPVDSRERLLLGLFDLKGPIAFWNTPADEPVQTSGTGMHEVVTVGSHEYEMPAWSIGDGFGSYVISNHFAGGIGLTVPLACGFWLLATAGRLPSLVRYTVAVTTLAAAVVTIGWLANSRAGAASMLLAALVFLWLTVEGRAWRLAIGGLVAGYVAFLVLFCVAFFGPWTVVEQVMPQAVTHPLRSLRSDGRVVATRVAGQMLAGSPLLGTGIGTFGDLQPTYLGNVFLLYYAHNDYMQLLAETGLAGGCVAAGLVVMLIARSRRWYRDSTVPDRLLDAGPWAALAGLALHSAFDWNLHVPANAFLAAIGTGLAVSSSHGPRDRAGDTPPLVPNVRASWAPVLLAAACLMAIVLLVRDAVSTAARRQLALAVIAARTEPPAAAAAVVQRLDRALAAGTRAARFDPSDTRLARLLGQAMLHRADRTGDKTTLGMDAANEWFLRARLACPICRGIPHSVASAGTR